MLPLINPPSTGNKEVDQLFSALKAEGTRWTLSGRSPLLNKIHDQLHGGTKALQEKYHPRIEGTTNEQNTIICRIRTHENWARPALDRLVNSIHAGKIDRKVKVDVGGVEKLRSIINSKAHRRAMRCLAENAFAYGTGFLVPILNGENITYWFPNPRHTAIIANPLDITDIIGIVESIPDITETSILGYRFITKEVDGRYEVKGSRLTIAPHSRGHLPVVIAYGQDRRHEGDKYGGSLIEAAVDASIEATNNKLNLKLLRDRQTQALLILYGQPANASDEMKETLQRFIMYENRESGGAEFLTPESRLEQVIRVRDCIASGAAVSLGLPLDTFLPEKVTGSDASATAARNRAFPLNQKMVSFVEDWEETESRSIAVIAGLFQSGKAPIDVIEARLKIEVNIRPSLPEAESETLANWIQKVQSNFVPARHAVDFYFPSGTEEEKEALASKWEKKNSEIYQYHIESGVVTINEARSKLGLGPIEGGDLTYTEILNNTQMKEVENGGGTQPAAQRKAQKNTQPLEENGGNDERDAQSQSG